MDKENFDVRAAAQPAAAVLTALAVSLFCCESYCSDADSPTQLRRFIDGRSVNRELMVQQTMRICPRRALPDALMPRRPALQDDRDEALPNGKQLFMDPSGRPGSCAVRWRPATKQLLLRSCHRRISVEGRYPFNFAVGGEGRATRSRGQLHSRRRPAGILPKLRNAPLSRATRWWTSCHSYRYLRDSQGRPFPPGPQGTGSGRAATTGRLDADSVGAQCAGRARSRLHNRLLMGGLRASPTRPPAASPVQLPSAGKRGALAARRHGCWTSSLRTAKLAPYPEALPDPFPEGPPRLPRGRR